MQEKKIRESIISLVQKEVVPAIGCTEPMAVALCTAKAATVLGCRPEKINVLLSPNMLKNAMGVGIPGTGMIGLPIAVSLGALIGKPEYELEVLKDLTPETLEQGKRFIEDADIDIKLKEGNVDKLYIEVMCRAGEHAATAIISGSHTHFVFVDRDGEVVLVTMMYSLTSAWCMTSLRQLLSMRFLSSSRPKSIISKLQNFPSRATMGTVWARRWIVL